MQGLCLAWEGESRQATPGITSRVIEKENWMDVSRMEMFVKNHEKSHFLQTPRWAGVKEFWQWRGILVYQNEEIVGAMSVLIRPLPFGRSILYAPRGPVCDRNDPFLMAELFAAVEDLAIEVNALELLMDPDEPAENGEFRQLMEGWGFREQENMDFGNIQAQHVIRLHLVGKHEDSVFADFCPKTRYNVRLAIRKGVQVRKFYGDEGIPEEELEAFSALMEETGQRDHFIPRGKEYYRSVFRNLGREAVLFMAYLDGLPIAGTIGVYSGRKGWYLYGASSNEHRNVMPNYLLQWEMVRCALGRNCVFYDFRGVPGELSEDNPLYGLYRFKKGFGGTYTKFTGLFVFRYCPILARCFEVALNGFRKLRSWKRCK